LSTGLIALLDDIATLAKVAAATIDDAAAQSTKAASKAAGIVIDDAAVTPRYVVGFSADREVPIIAKIAKGSLKNKLLFILPAAIALSAFLPVAIPILLMVGGAYLCMEGFHKVMDLVRPHESHAEPTVEAVAATPKEVEDRMVESATRTDFILSAEIMVIALATISETTSGEPTPIWLQAAILAVVGVCMTVIVYGAVALIVKADDFGVMLARGKNKSLKPLGRAIVKGMPHFLKALSFIGMIAMLWVGGGIVIHELHVLHWWSWPEETIHAIAHGVGHAAPPIEGVLTWFTQATLAALVGLGIGALVDPLARFVFTPAIAALTGKKPASAH
jgi:predicted DNA repair protein MutK